MADINQYFQDHLGRAADQGEFDFFNRLISNGHIQPYEIGQVLQGTPEYQSALLSKNTAKYGDQLNAQNAGILDQAAAAANSRFTSLGRPVTSAQSASVLQAGGQLAQQRQSALADFYGRGLQQNASISQMQGNSALGRAYQLQDESRQRAYQLDDFNRMHDLQQDQMNASNHAMFSSPGLFKAGLGLTGQIGASVLGARAGRSSQNGGMWG